nr:MAG TPA: hypothetical protein [Caudoviricetes sp.]
MDFFPGKPFFQPVEGDGINSIARTFQPFRRGRLGQLIAEIPGGVELIIRIRHGLHLRSGVLFGCRCGLCLAGLLGGCCGLNGGRIHSFIAVAVLHQLDGQRVVSLQHIAGNDVLKLCHYDSSFLLLCALLLENQVRGDDLGAVVIEQADGGRLGQRNLLGGVGVCHDRLRHRAVNHQQIVAACGQVSAGLDLDTMPCVELLRSGVHVCAGHLVEVVAHLAIVGGGHDQTHHGARHTVHEVVCGVLGLLNNGFQFVLHAGACSDSHLDSGLGCSLKEVLVQLGSHTQNMVCGAAVQNAVYAVQLHVLVLHLFHDLAVVVDGYGHSLGLDLAALACGAGGAVLVGGGVCETLCLHGASGRVAGQVGVLHVSRNQRFLHVLDDLAVQFSKIFLAALGGQNAKRFDSCHVVYLPFGLSENFRRGVLLLLLLIAGRTGELRSFLLQSCLFLGGFLFLSSLVQTSILLFGRLHEVVEALKCAVLPLQAVLIVHHIRGQLTAGVGGGNAVFVQLALQPVALVALGQLGLEVLLGFLGLLLVLRNFGLDFISRLAVKAFQGIFSVLQAGGQVIALCRNRGDLCFCGLNVKAVELEHCINLLLRQAQLFQFGGFHVYLLRFATKRFKSLL